jgi:nucleoside-diphosphate-sugar epimerase
MGYRQGDVRDVDALAEAFAGADVVVHLAFLIISGKRDITQAINVEGTLNAFRAAAAVGARRFVYASSIAAYGFHRDNPVGITEEWPTRSAGRLFYAQEKAEVEQLLTAEAARHPDTDLYLLRPPIVLGPHAVGAKADLPEPLRRLARRVLGRDGRLPVPLPVLVPELPVQLIHQDDVGSALLQCVVGAGPPGAYNIAADDLMTVAEVVRELGLFVIPLPAGPAHGLARALARLPALPTVAGWVEAASHPAVMDTTRAKNELGWTPRHSAREALRETFRA